MRTKIIIDGLNNTQKFRAVINGVIIGDCQVKDLVGNRFGQREQRVAVWDALSQIAMRRRAGTTLINGYGTNRDGVDVQIDLI
jgi:hypothetical protein